MTIQEKIKLEELKRAAKAGINMRTDMSPEQKAVAMQQVDDAGHRVEALAELCRQLGITP